MKYLGIDYGSKKVGLALSDDAGTMGFPHSILPNSPRLVHELSALIAKEGIGAIVMGESRNFARAANAIAGPARELGNRLAEQAGIFVYFEDETLTSAEARRKPAKTQKSRKPKSHNAVDASAAALILTSYLSHDHD